MYLLYYNIFLKAKKKAPSPEKSAYKIFPSFEKITRDWLDADTDTTEQRRFQALLLQSPSGKHNFYIRRLCLSRCFLFAQSGEILRRLSLCRIMYSYNQSLFSPPQKRYFTLYH